MKKKIVFVHFFNSFSGSPMVLRTVIEALVGYESILITNRAQGFLTGLDIECKYFDFYLHKNRFLTFLNYLTAQIAIFFIIISVARNGDLVYINTVIPVSAAVAGRIKGAKILFHLHEDRRSLNFIHRAVSFFRRYFCDYEIFVSDYLFNNEHIPGKKCCVIGNSLTEEFFNRAIQNTKIDVTDEGFNVLMISSLRSYKGVFEFMRIAENLIHEKQIKFTLVTSDSKEDRINFFDRIIVPGNVVIYDSVKDTVPFYKEASIVLNLSRIDEWVETFGLTILEGLTFGLPCIVPPIGGPSDLIQDGVNGYKVSSYDTIKIADLICKLNNDKDLYNSISVNNRFRALDFKNSVFNQRIQTVVDEMLG